MQSAEEEDEGGGGDQAREREGRETATSHFMSAAAAVSGDRDSRQSGTMFSAAAPRGPSTHDVRFEWELYPKRLW